MTSTSSHEDADPAPVAANPTLQAESKTSAVEKACQDPIVNEKGGGVRGQETKIANLDQVLDGQSL